MGVVRAWFRVWVRAGERKGGRSVTGLSWKALISTVLDEPDTYSSLSYIYTHTSQPPEIPILYGVLALVVNI